MGAFNMSAIEAPERFGFKSHNPHFDVIGKASNHHDAIFLKTGYFCGKRGNLHVNVTLATNVPNLRKSLCHVTIQNPPQKCFSLRALPWPVALSHVATNNLPCFVLKKIAPAHLFVVCHEMPKKH